MVPSGRRETYSGHYRFRLAIGRPRPVCIKHLKWGAPHNKSLNLTWAAFLVRAGCRRRSGPGKLAWSFAPTFQRHFVRIHRVTSLPDSWKDYRHRARAFWASALGLFPAFLLVSWLLNFITQADVLYLLVGLGLFALLFWTNFRVMNFPCPRCGQPFFHGAGYFNGFARKCVNCKLPKWAEPTTNESANSPMRV